VIEVNEMNSNLIPFKFEDKNIRVLMIEGNPWWVASDVCAVLGISNGRDAVSRLDDDERQRVAITDSLINQGFSDNVPGTTVTLINEPGLYGLVLTSRKPEAKLFKRWITHEVLPSIRQQGGYQIPAIAHTKALTIHQAAADQLEQELRVGNLLSAPLHIVQQEAIKIVRKQTGVDWSHYLQYAPAQLEVQPEEVMLEPTELATMMGFKSAIAANKWLASIGYQERKGKLWVPTDDGQPHCTIHSWTKTNKEGYNLRWNVKNLQHVYDQQAA